MKNDGDKGAHSPDPVSDLPSSDPPASPRIALVRVAMNAVIALVALVALATSIPHWGGDEFPVLSLVIYVAGMVFIAMPLCLCHEALLKSQREQRTARQDRLANHGWHVLNG